MNDVVVGTVAILIIIAVIGWVIVNSVDCLRDEVRTLRHEVLNSLKKDGDSDVKVD